MTLSQRTVLIIVSTFIVLLIILAATSDVILLKSFASLERTVLTGNVQRVRNEIDKTFDELDSTSQDFSDYLLKSGTTNISNYNTQTFVNHHVDIVLVFSSSGQILFSQAVDFHHHKPVTLPENYLVQLARVPTLAAPTTNKVVSGVILLGDEPLQLFLRPVHDSGVMVLVGRYLDDDEVRRISTLTTFSVQLFTTVSGTKTAEVAHVLADFKKGIVSPHMVLDSDRIAGYSLFKDLSGQPVLIARLVEKRVLYGQGKAAIAYVLLSLLIAGTVFCFAMLFFIKGTILKRIEFLSGTVKKLSSEPNPFSRLPLSGENDELTELAGSINAMLDSIEVAENSTRDSEERYRILFERAPDSIFIIGLDGEEVGKIISANRAAAEQHGYTIDELCKMSIFDINIDVDKENTASLIKRISGGEWITKEVWHSKKDKSRFPMEVHAGMVKIQGCSYILAFDRDITIRKLAEESDRMYLERIRQLNAELKRKANDLAAANYELESFNYSVSHDMRGPLTRISGYCQIMLEEDVVLDPQIKSYIGRIHESGLWLNEMIDAMLHLAQLARAELIPELVDLSKLTEELTAELKLLEPDRNTKTVVMKDVIAAGDPSLLKILITNLLNNAWKYSSGIKDACIEFGMRKEETGPVYFIRDNGAGFDMKLSSKLFKVFSRLHDSSEFSGTGIGLATAQRIVARHGGRIWAEAEIGRGATFFFTLQPDMPSIGPRS